MQLKTFGNRLKFARQHYARITQIELQRRMKAEFGVKIGNNYISELEKETTHKRVSFEVARAMAGVLKISMDYLACFTADDELVPSAPKESAPPIYFSEQADEIAQLVDTLYPAQRKILLDIARDIAAIPAARQHRENVLIDALDLIERNHGREARETLVHFMQTHNILVNRIP